MWKFTKGSITKETIDKLRLFVLNKYQSEWSHNKVLSFAKAFLKFLIKVRLDTRYHAFEVFLDRPRAVKTRNNVTSRIFTKEDIENVLAYTARQSKTSGLTATGLSTIFLLSYSALSRVSEAYLQFLSSRWDNSGKLYS